jgi:hypothetical protein
MLKYYWLRVLLAIAIWAFLVLVARLTGLL